MTPEPPLVSVVVPTRNEADNVGPLVERIAAALAATGYEICFVDDSDDDTSALLAELASADSRVRCLLRTGVERQGGLRTAVVAGLRMARGRYVCVIDADLQHPPELIPALLAEAERGADLVVASRYGRGGSSAGLDGGVRRLVSRGATAVARLLFTEARRSRDPLSGFFLCRRTLIDGIEFRPVGFKILLELLVCVPSPRVVDVPVAQAARGSGQSKASAAQGLQYLRHVRSLFVDVPGSARIWKFGLVGVSGLCVFLPVLFALSGPAGLSPLLAFVPAFVLSALWNAALNWRWTFADQRRGGRGPRHYLEFAVLSGCVMFGVFTGLIQTRIAPVLAGLGAALVAMLLNGFVNRALVHNSPSAWSSVAVDQGVQAALARLAAEIGADRAYVLPATRVASSSIPAGLLSHVIAHRRPTLITEAASHRAQRRTNIDASSRLLLPIVHEDRVAAVVVCERYSPRGFDAGALETATLAVAGLEPALATAVAAPHGAAEVGRTRPAAGTAG